MAFFPESPLSPDAPEASKLSQLYGFVPLMFRLQSGIPQVVGPQASLLEALELELKRERICADLDRRRIAVNLPALLARGFQTWAEGWADPEGRQAIQRLFSKLMPRLDPVKSFVLSE